MRFLLYLLFTNKWTYPNDLTQPRISWMNVAKSMDCGRVQVFFYHREHISCMQMFFSTPHFESCVMTEQQ